MTFKLRAIAAVCLAAVLLFSGTAIAASGHVHGDADTDGKVMILDATCIQRKLAGLTVKGYDEAAADADRDGSITILDATEIQRWLAGIGSEHPIGEQLTEPATEPTSERATDAEGWGRDILQP